MMTKKDKKILRSMRETYGKDAGTRVFYASATKGILGHDVQKRHGAQYRARRKTK